MMGKKIEGAASSGEYCQLSRHFDKISKANVPVSDNIRPT